ncbi:uncharacterized protein LOC125617601 isoform X2 [Marmota marmota marmota]|uniref:uncharacterized protein LOC125617601 isoform X2 n=1 Tax=Marmota marmota marmota TaxID=9994 RepID=UPI002092C561|nr:uncharacterized protein LOC125617601 isoform X2 [Marmota marmota marmota]
MAAGLHLHRKTTLPSFSSRRLSSSHEQGALDLERSSHKTNGPQLSAPCSPRGEEGQEARRRMSSEQPVPGAVPVTPCKVAPQAGRLRSPPRASVYLIIGLQNELTRCGILKNMSDHEEFWKLVQEEGRGTEIKEKLQKIKFKMLNPRPQDAPRRREARPLVDADRQDRLCRWRQTRASTLGQEPCLPRTQEESQQRPLKSKIACKTGEKDSRSKIYLRRLYQMYSTSLANMEFSRRLMERDGRFADEHAERRAGGLLDFMVPNEDTRQEEVQPREMGTEDPPPIGRQPGTRPALRFLKCQSPASAQRTPHQKTGGRQVALCGMRNLAEHVKGEPAPPGMTTAPLALEHMILTHRVVEAKTGSRYWINYVVEE